MAQTGVNRLIADYNNKRSQHAEEWHFHPDWSRTGSCSRQSPLPSYSGKRRPNSSGQRDLSLGCLGWIEIFLLTDFPSIIPTFCDYLALQREWFHLRSWKKKPFYSFLEKFAKMIFQADPEQRFTTFIKALQATRLDREITDYNSKRSQTYKVTTRTENNNLYLQLDPGLSSHPPTPPSWTSPWRSWRSW